MSVCGYVNMCACVFACAVFICDHMCIDVHKYLHIHVCADMCIFIYSYVCLAYCSTCRTPDFANYDYTQLKCLRNTITRADMWSSIVVDNGA